MKAIQIITKKNMSRGRRFLSDKVVGLIGILEDRNSSFRLGPAKAPPIIRQHFFEPAVNTWSELGIEVSDRISDFGDFTPESRTHDDIFRSIEVQMDIMQRIQGLIPLTLGGDHSITFAASKAVRKFIGKPLVIVHFDAHNDIYDSYEGDLNSHACPFARICEVPDFCEQLISIGIRTLNGEQKIQIQKFGVQVIEAKDFPAKGSDIRYILDKFIGPDTPVYITFDVDVIEPGLAPGVNHREAGGLSVRQAIDAIHCIPGRIVGADLAEYSPDRDVDFITASVAAKIMKELAGKIIASKNEASLQTTKNP